MLFKCKYKVVDAFWTVCIALAMQGFLILLHYYVRMQISNNPELAVNSYKFIGQGWFAMFLFCFSLAFFVMAWVKYKIASKEETISGHRNIFFLTKVLLFAVGACIAVELCYLVLGIICAIV